MSIAPDLLSGYFIKERGLTVDNPATLQEIGTVADYSPEDVQSVIEAAQLAMPSWAEKTAKERAFILRKWHDLLLLNQDTLAEIITAECGKPIIEARGEVIYAATFLEWFAEEGKRLYGDIIPHHAKGKRILVVKQPIGVTAAITPWNFPVAMITRKAGPALAAGCPMIVKPAEATPLSALALEKLAREAGVPDDIFRVVTTTKPNEIGDILCASPTVRKLSFTGSTQVGKLLAKKCAATVKKISLELGGNAPFIVFEDADLESAIDGAVASKYRNAGQTCVCTNRFLVHENILEEFLDRFTARVRKLKVGNGSQGAHIGPLINQKAIEKVEQLVENALSNGAQLVLGGQQHNAGKNFFDPTILTNVTSGMSIANEEIFGPVASIIPFKEEEEAIAIANDTPYGLAAYFYTKDMARVWRVMEKLEYGMVGVNEGIISTEVAPFGGIKESGIGREGSRYGIDEYIELKYCLLGGL